MLSRTNDELHDARPPHRVGSVAGAAHEARRHEAVEHRRVRVQHAAAHSDLRLVAPRLKGGLAGGNPRAPFSCVTTKHCILAAAAAAEEEEEAAEANSFHRRLSHTDKIHIGSTSNPCLQSTLGNQ
ncbi:hypothetical protein OPV22_028369 [Ensete ventricosum]|uniref:Uncharacterized protein n=1 Tax=Ensete ventricosum TaxID=4639 RepID=A0AAV8PYA1_ENSVE|nr:hypothetical protein OPV22_028369 [Ensete ventricosum]RZS06352.1 hypothetical protein BHM03_00036994 [Ensete ventricosum]